ncbi:hypothetical protein Tco_0220296, partial [Tanacetum coccineum]
MEQGSALNPQEPSCISQIMLLAYEGLMQRSHGVRKDFLYRLPLIRLYCGALILTFLASFRSSDSRPLIKYSQMGVIQFYSVSAATVDTSLPFIDMFAKTSTNTSFVRCSKVMEANLL